MVTPAPYDFAEVEARWRRRWEDDGIARVDLDAATDVFVNLVEFPYPSAEGLHIGHVFRYCGVDAYGRYQRMRGRPVFQPIGFDSFGIHTENFALRAGQHPAALTERTIGNFRAQLSRIGAAWDWSRTVTTSDPGYYRWTQWVLCRLFDAGLMYRAEADVLWCPSCLTVLAREQTESSPSGAVTCERCDTAVVERRMRQWFLRITAYADRLLDGLDALDWPERAKRLQRNWIGRESNGVETRYRLHDWLISRQRYWGTPIPIVHCDSCGPVRVPDDQLPVLLPRVDAFRPTGTGTSPLAEAEEWVATTCPACGGGARRETDVSDTFVDSSWYFLRYASTEFDDRPFDAERTARVLPVDFYAGGSEHVQRHHLYGRFVTMALHDLGLVPFEEPFPRVRLGGMIIKDGAKMSKSRGNVTGPDDYISRHGSDVLRCALLFSAPWDHDGSFRDDAVTGIERFFARAWREVTAERGTGAMPASMSSIISSVTAAIDQLFFNVALARLMEVVSEREIMASAAARRVFVRLLAPLAPHLAEELWKHLGQPYSVHAQPWPEPSSVDVRSPTVEIAVQIDGRLRGVVRLDSVADEAAALAAARESVSAVPGDVSKITRVVYVPGRVINIVTH